MHALNAETRLTQLRLCALLDTAITKTNMYIERYNAIISHNIGSARLQETLEQLSFIKQLFTSIHNTVCTSEETPYTAILRAYNTMTNNYERVIVLNASILPSTIRQLYYEIYSTLRSLLD